MLKLKFLIPTSWHYHRRFHIEGEFYRQVQSTFTKYPRFYCLPFQLPTSIFCSSVICVSHQHWGHGRSLLNFQEPSFRSNYFYIDFPQAINHLLFCYLPFQQTQLLLFNYLFSLNLSFFSVTFKSYNFAYLFFEQSDLNT